eukprot:c10079_g1_i1 orf=619-834(-)
MSLNCSNKQLYHKPSNIVYHKIPNLPLSKQPETCITLHQILSKIGHHNKNLDFVIKYMISQSKEMGILVKS